MFFFNFRQLQKCHDLRLLSWKVLFKGSTMNWSGKRTVFVCVWLNKSIVTLTLQGTIRHLALI